MAQLDPAAFGAIVSASKLVTEYAVDVDPQSAKEMLAGRMAQAQTQAAAAQFRLKRRPLRRRLRPRSRSSTRSRRPPRSAPTRRPKPTRRERRRGTRRGPNGQVGRAAGTPAAPAADFDLGQAAKIGAKVIGVLRPTRCCAGSSAR